MKQVITSSLAFVAAVMILGAAIIFMFNNPIVASGSVVGGNEYNSTTTRATSAGTHWLAKSTSNTSYCAIGSLIVASSSATTLVLWDATSTTDVSSTTIATFKAAIGEGTYTFDTTCKRGLIIETPAGFNGEYIVTWR